MRIEKWHKRFQAYSNKSTNNRAVIWKPENTYLSSQKRKKRIMSKVQHKKYTQEEAIKIAKKMIANKREWSDCIRSGKPLSTLKDKRIDLVELA